MTVKGLIHCHSTLSFDGEPSLEEIKAVLSAEGFDFVAMTEHSTGVGDKAYREYVAKCRELSDETFVFVPGVEFLCELGTEVLGIGLNKLIVENKADKVIEKIHGEGGYAILAHPWKRREFSLFPRKLYDLDAIELLNAKEDGTVSPRWGLMRAAKRWVGEAKAMHVIFGADLHSFAIPRRVWVECELLNLSEIEILKSLKAGIFENRSVGGTIKSSGPTQLQSAVYIIMRVLYLVWNVILKLVPIVVSLKMSQLLNKCFKLSERKKQG